MASGAGDGTAQLLPGARTARELEPVLRALAERPVPFAAAYLNRWTPSMKQMRELVRGGAIGRLTSVELRMVTTQVGMRNPASWLFSREVAGGGILAWLGCHWFDAVRYMFPLVACNDLFERRNLEVIFHVHRHGVGYFAAGHRITAG